MAAVAPHSEAHAKRAAHARRSPSGADTWMLCAGSVSAADAAKLPRRNEEYSAKGTVCHEVAAQCAEFDLDPYDYVGKTLSADGFSFVFDAEMARWIDDGLDAIRDTAGQMFVEHRVALDHWLPGDFGTLDLGFVGEDLITIYDWKFGWLKVEVVNNRQLRIYALGFWYYVARHLTKARRFRLVINQPQAGGISEWFVDLDELLEFGEEVRAAGVRTDEPDAPRVAGEKQCFWCDMNPERGGPGCYALTDFNLDLVGQKLSDIDDDIAMGAPPSMPVRSDLTPAQRYFIVKHKGMFTRWLAALHEESLAAADAGTPDPGSKVVDGDREDRKWAGDGDADLLGSEAEAILIDTLGDKAFTKKLKSPAQVEKVLKPTKRNPGNPVAWKRLQDLITQGQGKPILVPEEDRKPARVSIHDRLEEEPEDVEFDLLK